MTEDKTLIENNDAEFNIWDHSVPVEKSAYLVEQATYLNYVEVWNRRSDNE